ncbi:hypothetical protein [Clostridium sp. N3C]|uniref:hypothetical protein n=1 Tax=Clostridium sp. N3C TaxID=1776758 RepID=UPI001177B4B9|nr:hypothetical protein [Clostridium sp. N3C]
MKKSFSKCFCKCDNCCYKFCKCCEKIDCCCDFHKLDKKKIDFKVPILIILVILILLLCQEDKKSFC